MATLERSSFKNIWRNLYFIKTENLIYVIICFLPRLMASSKPTGFLRDTYELLLPYLHLKGVQTYSCISLTMQSRNMLKTMVNTRKATKLVIKNFRII